MGRNGRSAGRRFEQQIARDLRDWLGEDWRVARNQTDRQKGQVEGCYGEFMIEGPTAFPFTIECKDRGEFDEHQLWKPEQTAAFRGYWEQAKAQAEQAGTMPLLIFKKAGPRPRLIAMPGVLLGRLILTPRRGDLDDDPLMHITVGGDQLLVMRWESFLKYKAGAVLLAGVPVRAPTPRDPKDCAHEYARGGVRGHLECMFCGHQIGGKKPKSAPPPSKPGRRPKKAPPPPPRKIRRA